MTRHACLPTSQRMRLGADKLETQAKIAEVRFDPETGKIASNHVSATLDALMELAESLSTNELRHRMNVKFSEGVLLETCAGRRVRA